MILSAVEGIIISQHPASWEESAPMLCAMLAPSGQTGKWSLKNTSVGRCHCGAFTATCCLSRDTLRILHI